MTAPVPDTPDVAVGSQYLSFELDGESYAVDILKVQEIRGWQPVRELPEAPVCIRGIMDLRGMVLPVMDLRLRFGREPVEYTPLTVVIVLTLRCGENRHGLGIVVDSVSDVLDVKADSVKPPPALGCAVHPRYIRGILPGERMVVLLDADQLISPGDWKRIEGGIP